MLTRSATDPSDPDLCNAIPPVTTSELSPIPMLSKARAAGVPYEAVAFSLNQAARLRLGELPAWWSLVAMLPEPAAGQWPIMSLRIDEWLASMLRPIVEAQIILHGAGVNDVASLCRLTSSSALLRMILAKPLVGVEIVSCGTNLIRSTGQKFFVGNKFDPSLEDARRDEVIIGEINSLAEQAGLICEISTRGISGPLLEKTPWLKVAGHMRGNDLVEVIVRGIPEDEHDRPLARRIRDEATDVVHARNATDWWDTDGPILSLVVEVLFAASDADYR